MRPAGTQHWGLLTASAGTGALALALAKIEADSSGLSAVRLALAFFAIGLAPGIVLVLAGDWGRRLSGLTVLGLAAILSLSLAQFLCIVALVSHLTCHVLAVALVTGTAVGAVALMCGWRPTSQPLIFWPLRERWLLAFLLVVAAGLYPKGSPVYAVSFEDFWHLPMISRLAGSQAPAITATFVEPGLAFTHPVSGMHFFMALVVNASGEETIFVFNKMRSFAGLLAPLFLYLIAKRLFARPVTATWAGLGVLVLVLTGSLADTKWHWGQGAPVSHNTDLVMDMLVPGVVWMILATLGVSSGRQHRWWFGATGTLFLVLICSHVREAPQVLLYLAMFAATKLYYPAQGRRALALALLLIPMIYGYQKWHHENVPQITEHVSQHREALEHTMRTMHGADWWRAPVAVYAIETLWTGWHAVFIIALPLTLAWWGRRREALGVILCLIAALLLIRLPALSLAINWATYDEILMFPVRFFTPFSLLLPGALLWGLTTVLRPSWFQIGMVLGGIAGLIWAKSHAEELIARQPELFFGLASVTLLVALSLVLRRTTPRILNKTVRGRTLGPAVPLLITGLFTGNLACSPFGWLSRDGQASSVVLQHRGGALWTWRELMGNLRDSPPTGLIKWIRREVPPDEVVISNPAGIFPLTGFVPNPGYGWSVVFQLGLSTPLRDTHKESYARNGGPPFFNRNESPAERLALCRRLGAHIIVLDPSLIAYIKPLLDSEPEVYSKSYEDRGWYIYRVHLGPPINHRSS